MVSETLGGGRGRGNGITGMMGLARSEAFSLLKDTVDNVNNASTSEQNQ